MSNLTDFFPSTTRSELYGQAGDPPYLLTLLLIAGGSGASAQSIPSATMVAPPACLNPYISRSAIQGTGGGIFHGNTVAAYPGCQISITIGSGGNAGSYASAGTPGGKGTPGSPSTFGCITAYGGGAPATICSCTSKVRADDGGIGGGGGGRQQSLYIALPCTAGGDEFCFGLRGQSTNYCNQFGRHFGNYWMTREPLFGKLCVTPYTAPLYSTAPVPNACNCGSVPSFYCLDIDGVPACTPVPACWTTNISSPVSTNSLCYRTDVLLSHTRCIGMTCCTYPIGPVFIACKLVPRQSYDFQGLANAGWGGSMNHPATSGAAWVVYPNAYPAATTTGATDCTPKVLAGFRAYKFTSPGTFQLS